MIILAELIFHFFAKKCCALMQMGPGFPVSIQSLSIAADRYTRLQLNWFRTIIPWLWAQFLASDLLLDFNLLHSSQKHGSVLVLPLLGEKNGFVMGQSRISKYKHAHMELYAFFFIISLSIPFSLFPEGELYVPADDSWGHQFWPTFISSNSLSSCVCSL